MNYKVDSPASSTVSGHSARLSNDLLYHANRPLTPVTKNAFEPDINHRIWQAVADIPAGRVSTYGGVARSAGLGRAARRVGAALRGLPEDTRIPWHRVINAQGKIAFTPGSDAYNVQKSRLEQEGIRFSISDRIDLEKQGW